MLLQPAYLLAQVGQKVCVSPNPSGHGRPLPASAMGAHQGPTEDRLDLRVGNLAPVARLDLLPRGPSLRALPLLRLRQLLRLLDLPDTLADQDPDRRGQLQASPLRLGGNRSAKRRGKHDTHWATGRRGTRNRMPSTRG